jgi:choline dehydrogenase-like flavoprotein
MTAAFESAMASLQFRYQADFNGPDPEGFGPRQGAIRDGRRESGVTAFLRPAMNRPNLTVITQATVARVTLDGARTTGVEILRGAERQAISAQREVILAGGAIGSPQMLLLSGIGDCAALQRFGIPVAHHLPSVGANYHDHISAYVQMWMSNADSYGISPRSVPRGLWNIFEYLVKREGPFASNVFEAHALIRSTGGLDRPDLQIVFQAARRNQGTFPLPLGHGFSLSVVLLYPKSRGRLTLSSADPRAVPLIDPKLMSDKRDLDPIVRGLKLARRIANAPAFEAYQAHEFLPGSSVPDEDEPLKEYIRATAATTHHPCGSCKMGVDDSAVVTPELKVRGIEGLRIADASIFPTLIGGNTNAAVVMIAEKASDMILGRAPPARLELPHA